jgi:hypothetical protein
MLVIPMKLFIFDLTYTGRHLSKRNCERQKSDDNFTHSKSIKQNYFILLMIIVHRGRASFYLGEFLSREIPPDICVRLSAGFMTLSFDGMVLLNWDFDKYPGAFHRLRVNCHLVLEQVDPFLHAENAQPFCGGRFNLLHLYIKAPAILLDARIMFGDAPRSRMVSSASLRSVMFRKQMTAPTILPLSMIGRLEYDTGIELPSLL